MAVSFGALDLSGLAARTPFVWLVAVALLLAGLSLIVGFMTPFASLLIGLCILGISLSWLPAPAVASMTLPLAALFLLITAVAIALLGPGAFSVDGHLFGRREIVIPPLNPKQ
jgi:putative oxidoreductase